MVAIALAAAMVMTTFAGCGGAEETVETQKSENTEKTSEDAVKNLIASTKGTVTLNLWCDETESYQKTMKQLVEDFKNQYDQVDFDITIGAVSTANCKDEVLADVEKAADVFVFADDQLYDLEKAGALQSVDATFTYDPKEENEKEAVEAASVDETMYAYPLTASNGYFLYYDSNYLTPEDVASWDQSFGCSAKTGQNSRHGSIRGMVFVWIFCGSRA